MDLRQVVACALLALSALVASFGSAHAQRKEKEISLEVGQQATISAEGYTEYSVGDKSIIDIRKSSTRGDLIIVGKSEGETSVLLIADNNGSLTYNVKVRRASRVNQRSQVEMSENVRLDLYFVQIADTYSHNIGIAWPTSYPSNANNSGVTTNVTTTFPATGGPTTSASLAFAVQQILPRLDVAQSKGWARVYRQVALVTANGTGANFHAGGEVNVAVAAGLTGSLEKVKYGTDLECVPKYDPQTGRLELSITASVADLSTTRGTGVPGRTTSSVQSVVNLTLGQSIILGGFIAKSETREQGGLVGLSRIPILGTLFGTNVSRFENSEGLVFIVPSVVEPVSLTERNRIQEALEIYEEFSGGVDETSLLEQPRLIRD